VLVAHQLAGLSGHKVWLQMSRKGILLARCTVERLMRAMGLQAARSGMSMLPQRQMNRLSAR